VKNIGHFGTGDLEITMVSQDDLERAKPLILTSYEALSPMKSRSCVSALTPSAEPASGWSIQALM
jgi:hypothetical protein